jgi:tetratricopeptide (TPR) repeat protein
MKRPQLVSPGSLARMLAAARESWKRRDFQQSIDTLERAAKLAPADSTILFELGRFHGLRYDYAAAERCFEKAIRLSPHPAHALMMAGSSCRGFASQDMSERYYQRVVERPDAPPEAFVDLCDIRERQHRLEEAAALIERALQLDKSCGPALLARARLHRQSGQLESAETAIRSLLSQPDPGAPPSSQRNARILAWYELGAILDKQKRFDDAMAAFLQAKSMLRLHAGQELADLKHNRTSMQTLRESLSAAALERWHQAGAQFQPTRRLALLGGHPRSGTTLLEQVLDSHPDIVSAEETEIFYDHAATPLTASHPPGTPLLNVLESATSASLQKARDGYCRSMDLSLSNPVGGRLLIDKNPSLTLMIPFLARVFPEMKFLVALRDPRDVCLSVFMQPLVPLSYTSAAYLSLGSTVEDYAAVMGMWRTASALAKNPRLEVRYEDMVNDLESVARRVLEFLGVPWDAAVLRFDEHARQKAVRSPTYADVTKPVFKTAVGRWRNYQKFLEPHLAALEPFAKAFGYE